MVIVQALAELAKNSPEENCTFMISATLPKRRLEYRNGKQFIVQESGDRKQMMNDLELSIVELGLTTKILYSSGVVIASGKAKDLDKLKKLENTIDAIRPNQRRTPRISS